MAFIVPTHCERYDKRRDNKEIHTDTEIYITFEEEKEEDESSYVTELQRTEARYVLWLFRVMMTAVTDERNKEQTMMGAMVLTRMPVMMMMMKVALRCYLLEETSCWKVPAR